ncbi:MAG TPA: hypothetical protein VMJ33_10845 [Gallionella sp.]|nr:hypothetical protein [Gallionella sp.]
MMVSMAVSNYLKEVANMNSHILERITGEDSKDALHSIELFISMAVAITFVGLVFFAVA